LCGEVLASVCTAFPQTRPTALTTPTDIDGGPRRNVLPSAIVVGPGRIECFGTALGVARPSASTFKSEIIRL
jgi:hypothetical protein